MAKYRVDTDKGSYEVETDEPSASPVPGMEKLGGTPPGAPRVALPTPLSGTPRPGALSRRPTNREALGSPSRGDNRYYTSPHMGRPSDAYGRVGSSDNPNDEFRPPEQVNIPLVSNAVNEGPANVLYGAAQMGGPIAPSEKNQGMNRKTAFLRGGTRAMGGAVQTGAPFLPGAVIAAPGKALFGLGTGAVNAGLTYGGLKAVGADDDTAEFGAGANGLLAGGASSKTELPVSRLYGAAKAGSKASLEAIPILGKGLKAATADFAKSAPDYVDPKVARQAELTAQAGERAKANVQATAEARAKLKADAEAASAPPQYGVASTPAGVVPQAPPASAPPVSSAPPAGSPSLPTAALYGMPPRPAAPQGGPPLRPPMNPPPPDIPEGPVTRLLEIGRRNAGLNRSVLRPPVATPPSGPPPPAEAVAAQVPKAEPAPPVNGTPPVTNSSGPSAPEGSAVIPPVAGRPNRYGDMGGKLGEQVARDAHAKDTAVAKYLTEIKVTQGQFRAADAAQRARWAREANPKYKGYTDPDRIDDLANLLPPDAPTAPAGSTLYQGKQQ